MSFRFTFLRKKYNIVILFVSLFLLAGCTSTLRSGVEQQLNPKDIKNISTISVLVTRTRGSRNNNPMPEGGHWSGARQSVSNQLTTNQNQLKVAKNVLMILVIAKLLDAPNEREHAGIVIDELSKSLNRRIIDNLKQFKSIRVLPALDTDAEDINLGSSTNDAVLSIVITSWGQRSGSIGAEELETKTKLLILDRNNDIKVIWQFNDIYIDTNSDRESAVDAVANRIANELRYSGIPLRGVR